jgi:hypothetical protein
MRVCYDSEREALLVTATATGAALLTSAFWDAVERAPVAAAAGGALHASASLLLLSKARAAFDAERRVDAAFVAALMEERARSWGAADERAWRSGLALHCVSAGAFAAKAVSVRQARARGEAGGAGDNEGEDALVVVAAQELATAAQGGLAEAPEVAPRAPLVLRVASPALVEALGGARQVLVFVRPQHLVAAGGGDGSRALADAVAERLPPEALGPALRERLVVSRPEWHPFFGECVATLSLVRSDRGS